MATAVGIRVRCVSSVRIDDLPDGPLSLIFGHVARNRPWGLLLYVVRVCQRWAATL